MARLDGQRRRGAATTGRAAACFREAKDPGADPRDRQEPGAKSEAGDRLLKLSNGCVDMLPRRRIDADSGYPVFPDNLGGWRDPNLVMRWLRWSRDQAGFEWVTRHVFRQTVITVLDDAELNAREIADLAGHERISQTQEYMQRRVASERAAEILDGMF